MRNNTRPPHQKTQSGSERAKPVYPTEHSLFFRILSFVIAFAFIVTSIDVRLASASIAFPKTIAPPTAEAPLVLYQADVMEGFVNDDFFNDLVQTTALEKPYDETEEVDFESTEDVPAETTLDLLEQETSISRSVDTEGYFHTIS